jgi:predicted enzyme related to lactoylglutathione lyase
MKILVNIDVPELAPAIDFYCAALGLSLSRTLDEDVAELVGGSCVIYLLQNADGSDPGRGLAAPRRYSGHWTPVHIDFVVDDIEKAADRVVSAGGTRESECVEWRGSKCITFSDPFGNGFCLIEFAGETYAEE